MLDATILTTLLTTSETQHGVFSWNQALAAGVSDTSLRRLIDQGHFERIARGVYRVRGSRSVFHQWAMAATLGNEYARVSEVSAVSLYRFDGAVTPCEIDLVVGYGRGSVPRRILTPGNDTRSSIPVRVHRTRTPLATLDTTVVDGIPCVSPTLALLQIAATADSETLEAMFESAKRLGLTSAEHLQRRADARCGFGVPGSTAIRQLLANQVPNSGTSESRLEVKAWRLVRKRLSGQLPIRQHRVYIGADSFRLDMAWVDLRFAVECEGWEFHGNRLRWKRDRRRMADLEAAGWDVLVVTWDDVVRHPAQTIERIRARLA